MLLKAQEVAKILRLRPARVYELARSKVIPSIRISDNTIRFSESALQEFIDRGGVAKTNGNGTSGEQRVT